MPYGSITSAAPGSPGDRAGGTGDGTGAGTGGAGGTGDGGDGAGMPSRNDPGVNQAATRVQAAHRGKKGREKSQKAKQQKEED